MPDIGDSNETLANEEGNNTTKNGEFLERLKDSINKSVAKDKGNIDKFIEEDPIEFEKAYNELLGDEFKLGLVGGENKELGRKVVGIYKNEEEMLEKLKKELESFLEKAPEKFIEMEKNFSIEQRARIRSKYFYDEKLKNQKEKIEKQKNEMEQQKKEVEKAEKEEVERHNSEVEKEVGERPVEKLEEYIFSENIRDIGIFVEKDPLKFQKAVKALSSERITELERIYQGLNKKLDEIEKTSKDENVINKDIQNFLEISDKDQNNRDKISEEICKKYDKDIFYKVLEKEIALASWGGYKSKENELNGLKKLYEQYGNKEKEKEDRSISEVVEAFNEVLKNPDEQKIRSIYQKYSESIITKARIEMMKDRNDNAAFISRVARKLNQEEKLKWTFKEILKSENKDKMEELFKTEPRENIMGVLKFFLQGDAKKIEDSYIKWQKDNFEKKFNEILGAESLDIDKLKKLFKETPEDIAEDVIKKTSEGIKDIYKEVKEAAANVTVKEVPEEAAVKEIEKEEKAKEVVNELANGVEVNYELPKKMAKGRVDNEIARVEEALKQMEIIKGYMEKYGNELQKGDKINIYPSGKDSYLIQIIPKDKEVKTIQYNSGIYTEIDTKQEHKIKNPIKGIYDNGRLKNIEKDKSNKKHFWNSADKKAGDIDIEDELKNYKTRLEATQKGIGNKDNKDLKKEAKKVKNKISKNGDIIKNADKTSKKLAKDCVKYLNKKMGIRSDSVEYNKLDKEDVFGHFKDLAIDPNRVLYEKTKDMYENHSSIYRRADAHAIENIVNEPDISKESRYFKYAKQKVEQHKEKWEGKSTEKEVLDKDVLNKLDEVGDVYLFTKKEEDDLKNMEGILEQLKDSGKTKGNSDIFIKPIEKGRYEVSIYRGIEYEKYSADCSATKIEIKEEKNTTDKDRNAKLQEWKNQLPKVKENTNNVTKVEKKEITRSSDETEVKQEIEQESNVEKSELGTEYTPNGEEAIKKVYESWGKPTNERDDQKSEVAEATNTVQKNEKNEKEEKKGNVNFFAPKERGDKHNMEKIAKELKVNADWKIQENDNIFIEPKGGGKYEVSVYTEGEENAYHKGSVDLGNIAGTGKIIIKYEGVERKRMNDKKVEFIASKNKATLKDLGLMEAGSEKQKYNKGKHNTKGKDEI